MYDYLKMSSLLPVMWFLFLRVRDYLFVLGSAVMLLGFDGSFWFLVLCAVHFVVAASLLWWSFSGCDVVPTIRQVCLFGRYACFRCVRRTVLFLIISFCIGRLRLRWGGPCCHLISTNPFFFPHRIVMICFRRILLCRGLCFPLVWFSIAPHWATFRMSHGWVLLCLELHEPTFLVQCSTVALNCTKVWSPLEGPHC